METIISDKELVNREILGSGAFGAVYKAEWRNRPVAVKVFNFKLIGDDPSSKRELDVLAHLQSLDHNNIIKLFARGTEGRQTFMVMELAPYSLDQVLHEHKKEYDYSIDHVMSWALQLALALECCHKIKVLHRDIKPPNMLLFDEGRLLKICDFGTAKQIEQTNAGASTFIGTPYYLAPEVIEGEHSKECDIYSFAVTLWEMITRHKPTLNLNQKDNPHHYFVFRTIGKGTRLPVIKGIPRFLWELITRCWAQEPRERLSAAEIVRKLRNVPYRFDKDTALIDATRRRTQSEIQTPSPSAVHFKRYISHPPNNNSNNKIVIEVNQEDFGVVDDNEETIIEERQQPQQAIDPSSRYHIKGIEPNQQPYIPIEGNQESISIYTDYRSYMDQRARLLDEINKLELHKNELDSELSVEDIKRTKSTSSLHRLNTLKDENRKLEKELDELRK